MNVKELLQSLKQGDLTFGLNKHINPKKDAKFSPNLYRWFTWSRNKHFINVYIDKETRHYYIGIVQDGWFMGSMLMRIFCVGNKTESFAYAPKDTVNFQDVTDWFWEKYFELGKGVYSCEEWRKPPQQTSIMLDQNYKLHKIIN